LLANQIVISSIAIALISERAPRSSDCSLLLPSGWHSRVPESLCAKDGLIGKISGMPLRRALPNRRLRGDGAAIDHQTDLLDRTEAAILWVQARTAQFKRIVATLSDIEPFRAQRHSEGR
jgi:hypothetical protein